MNKRRIIIAITCFLPVYCSWAIAQENSSPDNFDGPWRYRMQRPDDGWMSTSFDDSSWEQGYGGFGMPSTPNARVGTRWEQDNVWLRRSIQIDEVPAKPALLMHHDEDVEVFLNGEEIFQRTGYTTEYQVFEIAKEKQGAIKQGDNLLAVHCRQTTGGQFIDVHLIDADNVPKLPPVKRSTTPFKSSLMTEWGAKVGQRDPWEQYPRPQLKRQSWQNLNGYWDYAITDAKIDEPQEWTGKILVPYCLESQLSRVQRLLNPGEVLWYRRSFEVRPAAQHKVLLNFEAVDYECDIFVNGEHVGGHRGGNTPFSVDVTNAIHDGENQLVVRVVDETGDYQLRGKQILDPHGIWYTRVSGIWQTVWLETVPQDYLEDIVIRTGFADGESAIGWIELAPKVSNPSNTSQTITISVFDGETLVAQGTESANETQRLTIKGVKPWSPADPFLYRIEMELGSEDSAVIDVIDSYVGVRTVGMRRDDNGDLRFTLNGEFIFHWGPLDQGWWPDGLLTPPSEEAMVSDIEYLKAAGFNMIRKHIKVEPRRYYYDCDRLGMMVWQDQVSGMPGPPWTRLKPNPTDANWPQAAHQQFMNEWEETIDLLENHPSIVVWIPFNEAWGQHQTMEVGKWTMERDPSRLVNVASGGNFWPIGHVVDQHAYPHPAFPHNAERFGDYIKVVGEFGGHGLPVEGHLWDANRRNWGYGGLPKDEDEYRQRYEESIRRLIELKSQGIAGAVYTQTTDVEGEINGLMTYDRKVIKIAAPALRKIHQLLTNE